MSISIRLVTLLIFLLGSILAYAQEKSYQYQLDGTYPATLPGLSSPRIIRFSLLWNEKNRVIEGEYTDNFFTAKSPVSGTAGIQGRVFNIRLPRIIQNVGLISLNSSTSTVKVVMKDLTEMTIDQATIQASAVIRTDYTEAPKPTCETCGLYKGELNEVSDSNNLCLLPDYGFRLEMTADNQANLYFYFSDSVIGIPTHHIGTYPAISNRHCGLLVGTNFSPASCQLLSLEGNFTDFGEKTNFRGLYKITEEKSLESCSYEMVLEREKSYE